ncbi:hypothetical protein Slin_6664 (plasmid) [Spirosoma linguale DSM 74]|uniref:Uncharacterized protein n=1 Tax=Spirosoma linguale (strain ATCC 33905 / DSM 74 / LMG 10896 / Claus 1) TaxID=504472 RepID=D2QUY9_SPILD|nr:hypothetical protein Slin_6664 [Spirosoma linguale DSM 74]
MIVNDPLTNTDSTEELDDPYIHTVSTEEFVQTIERANQDETDSMLSSNPE